MNLIVGALASLTTSVKTSIVNAINEIVTNIGTLSTLTTTTKSSIVGAINWMMGTHQHRCNSNKTNCSMAYIILYLSNLYTSVYSSVIWVGNNREAFRHDFLVLTLRLITPYNDLTNLGGKKMGLIKRISFIRL